MILPREHFETEHLATLRGEHRSGVCVPDQCPVCQYERQFPSAEHRKRWEEEQKREMLRTKYLF